MRGERESEETGGRHHSRERQRGDAGQRVKFDLKIGGTCTCGACGTRSDVEIDKFVQNRYFIFTGILHNILIFIKVYILSHLNYKSQIFMHI